MYYGFRARGLYYVCVISLGMYIKITFTISLHLNLTLVLGSKNDEIAFQVGMYCMDNIFGS